VLRDVDHLREELARAKAERKPVVVETWATWCVYCVKYDEIAAGSPRVRSRLERLVRLKIDATDDARNDLRAVLGIPEAQPRMRFVDRDGNPRPELAIDGWNGPQSETVLLRSLDGVL
jgi:thiol:disulfide interchange protein DsbD